jgi:acyl-CoA synthetase (AMP-forming)/AMP-acid ligase II
MLLYEVLEAHAAKNPDREAIIFKDRRISYAEYLDKVNGAAAAMVRLGVKRGDKVALYIGNRPEHAFCYIAAASLGAATVPVSTRFEAVEAGFIVGNSDSSFMVVAPGLAGVDFIEMVNQIKPSCPALETIAVMGGPEEVARVTGAIDAEILFGEPDAAALAALEKARAEVMEDDTAFIVYTSGTTGVPKGAELTHKNLISYVRGQTLAMDVNGEDRLLLDIPVNHVGGNVMAIMSMLYAGGTLVMLDAFVPQEVLETIQKEKITVMGQVPAQYILLMMSPDFDSYDVSSVRGAVVSAAPSPKELFGQVKEKFGLYPTNGFGLSEASGAVTFTRVDEDSFERLSTSVGKANPGIDISIMDPQGYHLPPGEEGEICIKGDAVMKGYYKRPDETELVLGEDGYLHTGDVGKLDEDGYMYILGRKKEMYIRGGENIYPPEVEDVLQEHPGVLFSAVIGVPDPVMGEEGRAYIVAMPGAEPPTEEKLKEWSSTRLARYKVPKYFVFRDALPLSPLGKVLKKVLYEELKGEEGPLAGE